MGLDTLLVALVLAVVPALGRPRRRPLSPARANEVVAAPRRWPLWRARLQEFWNQQIRLHQLYLNSFDVSGGDALDALAQRKRSVSRPH
jgi:hypothetical protein